MTVARDHDREHPYIVIVGDNYHYMDEDSEYQAGRYRTWEEAVERCRQIVDACLKHLHEPGMSAECLWSRYVMFGEDPFIVPSGDQRFSAWEYSKKRSAELCEGPRRDSRQGDGLS